MTLNSDESKPFLNDEVDSKLTSFARRFVRKLNLPEAAVDDIRQQVLDKLWPLSDERLNAIDDFDAYLFTAVRNEAYRFWQNTEEERHLSLDDEGVDLPASPSSIQESLESAQLLQGIWNTLKPEEREVFQSLIIGYNEKEIAFRLNITHDAARKRVARLRKKLLDRFQKNP